MLHDDVQLISVDDHVIEHERVWLDRLPAKYRDVGPHIVEIEGGTHCQVVGSGLHHSHIKKQHKKKKK